MKLDPASAWEDEFAMCVWGFTTPYLPWAVRVACGALPPLPDVRRGVAGRGRLWRESFTRYLKKLTVKHGKPLILKSPTHTCRIRLLLEMFPDARFVHIHRNPFAVYQSCLHLCETVPPMIRLQATDRMDWEAQIIRQYTEMHERFFAERPLTPAGRYHEVCFEELEKDPVGPVRALYEALGLPDFAHVEPRLREYAGSISGYRKNAYQELDPVARRRVASEWRRCFEEWGYSSESN